MKRVRMAALMFGVALGLGTLAVNAKAEDRDDRAPQFGPQAMFSQWSWNDGHFDHGHRDGMDAGGKDARKGKGYTPYDHGSYRDSHDRAYRDGYLRGYREAYSQFEDYRQPHYGDHGGYSHDRDDYDRDHDWH